jgi:predicted house-cleaning noncanonical NTP pyrophosphatase (MazG superfamily)
MKRYNKLVRDKVPEIIKKSGKTCKTRQLSDREYRHCLNEKLREEVDEFLESPCIEEIADIIEVLEALSTNLSSELSEVIEIKEKSRKNEAVSVSGFFLNM